MKLNILLSLSLLSLAASTSNLSAAETETAVTERKMVVALKTDEVDLHEMDISHLEPGDSETIVTEDGKTIDLLRTEDDVEIYIDGEMLDLGAHANGHHKVLHITNEEIEIDCTDEAECEELVWMSQQGEDADGGQQGAKKVFIIHKEVIAN